MANKMLIDATHPEETRVVVLRGNRVEEFDFESAHRKQLRGNIYLAKVTRVEPSLQAAFVDYGGNRHGFLAFSEIHPDYYQIPVADRQALIDEEERAQRAADDEVERRSRRHRGHDRGHAARRGRRGEAVHGDVAEGTTGDHLEGSAEAGAESEHDTDDFAPIETVGGGIEGGGEHGGHETEHEAEHEDDHEDVEAAGFSSAADGDEPHETVAERIADTAADLPPDAIEGGDHIAGGLAAESASSGEALDEHSAGGGEGAAAVARHDEHGDDEEHPEEIVESVGGSDALEEVPDRAPRYRRQYKIQEVIKRRQVMLVQVVKEERGTKGAALTTYLSLAGRYSVLMPNTARGGGISRKITNSEDRARLKEAAAELEVPEGMGVILRTAGASRTKIEIKRDFEYLLRMWETVRDLTLKSTAPKLVYEEGSLVKRSIRDLYSKDIDEVVVAGDEAYQEAKDFMRMLMPSHAKNVRPYHDTQPLLSRYGVESQLDAMFSPVVQLRSGGYIVINQAEALVAIDVNSGRATREHHIEDTALKTNLEAADEVSRQLRLRDLAGLIVIDFIDMDEKRNNRSVERRLKECLKHDRARIQVGRISHFGLLEMSRQRIRTSVLESSTEKCPYCGGSGHVRSVSSLALQVLRALEEQLMRGATHNLIARTRPDVALYVLNQKRAHLRGLEERFAITITISADESVAAPQAFVIDRGDLVHTVEAAKALAERNQAAIAPLEDEDEVEDFAGGEEEAEAESAAPAAEQGESGGRRRRRRRRRGGRNGGEAEAHTDELATAGEAVPHEHGQESGHENSHDHAHENGHDDADGEQPFAHAAEPHGDDEGEHDPEASAHQRGETGESQRGGERRRRRGRRGGRRNRQRNGETMHEGTEQAGLYEHGDDAPAFASEHEPSAHDHASAAEPRHDAAHEQNHEPAPDLAAPSRTEPALSHAVADLDAAPVGSAPSAEEPPRRRSTVRERAPVGSSEETLPPVPQSQTPATPDPVVTESGSAEEGNRPRRTGWWSRRFG